MLKKLKDTVMERVLRKKIRMRPSNKVCPISQEPLVAPIFKFVTSCGRVIGYNIRSLADYICATGDTHDPLTREQYNHIVLRRLDRELEAAGIRTRSVVDAVYNPHVIAARKREKDLESATEGLTTLVDNEVRRAMEFVATSTALQRIMIAPLVDSEFSGSLFLLWHVSREKCLKTIEYWRNEAFSQRFEEMLAQLGANFKQQFVAYLDSIESQLTGLEQKNNM